MAMITCPECNHNVSDQAESCPSCGFSIKTHIDEKINMMREQEQIQQRYDDIKLPLKPKPPILLLIFATVIAFLTSAAVNSFIDPRERI